MTLLFVIYVLCTLPLLILFAQTQQYRFETIQEISRKLAHVRRLDYLMLGDSLTAHGGYWGPRLGKTYFDAVNLAMPGFTIVQMHEQFVNGGRLHPRATCLLAGTNDRLIGRTDDQILADYTDLLDRAAKQGAERLVITSIPVKASPAEDAAILALNVRLKALVESRGAAFLDLNQLILQHPARASLYGPDGLHFAEPMYAIWSAALLAVTR